MGGLMKRSTYFEVNALEQLILALISQNALYCEFFSLEVST